MTASVYGMPWILDTKYLFYNKEILEKAGIKTPPKTWDELAEQAKIIKDKGLLATPIAWSWSQAEAAICDYTTLVSAYGGSFLKDGKPAFQTGRRSRCAELHGRQLQIRSHQSEFQGIPRRGRPPVFQNGEAAFALNWTYMYNLANDPKDSKVAGKVGVVPAPGVAGKSERFGRQRFDGPRHHLDQQASGRGVEIHHLHDLAGRRRTSTPSSACRSGLPPMTIRPYPRARKS